MANTASSYRDTEIMLMVERWWEQAAPFKSATLPILFRDYTVYVARASDHLYVATYILNYQDFVRTLYAIGVVNIVEDPALPPIYSRLESWRPSLDQVRRLEVAL